MAGLAWGFWPFRVAHLIHLQLQALYFLPLAVAVPASRSCAAGRRRDAIWLGVTAGLQAASSLYYGVMTAIALVATLVGVVAGVGRSAAAACSGVAARGHRRRSSWSPRRRGRTGGCSRREGFARNLYEASRHEAVLTSYLQVPPTNVIYGRTHLLTERDSAGALREGRHEGVEDELFPGVVADAARRARARRVAT